MFIIDMWNRNCLSVSQGIQLIKIIKKIDAYPMYTMDYSADYGLDEFLEKGASNDKELVEFVGNHVMKGLPLSIKIPDLGCSTFIAQNKNSGYLFGRNFDMDYSPSVLVKTKLKNGYASISMVNLSFVGYNEKYLPDTLKDSLVNLAAPYAPLDGMNEKGLAVGVLLIDTKPTNQNTKKVDITTTTAIRLMLDKAKKIWMKHQNYYHLMTCIQVRIVVITSKFVMLLERVLSQNMWIMK